MAKKPVRVTKASAEKAQVPAVGKLQLLGIRLFESASKVGMLRPAELPGVGTQAINFTHFTKLPGDDKATAVSVRIKLDLSYENDAPKDPAISIMATFVANYQIIEEFHDEEAFHQFLQHVGMANIWPYWREFAQSMTTRMGLPAFPVPLVNVAELRLDDEKTKV
jgi:hypothetical protein